MKITKEKGLIVTLSLIVLAVVSISIDSNIGKSDTLSEIATIDADEFDLFTDPDTGCQYMRTAIVYSKSGKGYIKTGFELTKRIGMDGISQHGCKGVK